MSLLDVVVNPSDANVDIVAVHGLNPFNNNDHAFQTWSKGDKLWLRDFFPSEVPKARIMIFGYDANVAFGRSTAGINDYAEALLQKLSMRREVDPRRPLIFVSHSLGGIVVKRAIVEAVSGSNERDYENIRNATYGLAFFGTPHKSSPYNTVARIAVKIARSVMNAPPSGLLRGLETACDASFTDELQRHFKHRLEDFHILSFYEADAMAGMSSPIVDRRSAVLDLPAKRERPILLQRSHRDICKFASKDDRDYEFVEHAIARMCSDAVQVRERQIELEKLILEEPGSVLSHTEKMLGKLDPESVLMYIHYAEEKRKRRQEKDECLQSLGFPELHRRYDDLNTENIIGDISTSDFVCTEEFQCWIANPTCDAILSLRGNPGSGKSILMKRVVKYFKELDRKLKNQATLSFFFDGSYDASQPHWNSSSGLYRTLLYQIIEAICQPPPELLRNIKTKAAVGGLWALDTLQEFLRQALQALMMTCQRIYVFLDALDEWNATDCGQSLGLSFLAKLISDESIPLKICVSARRHPSTYWNTPVVESIVNIESFNESDIEKFLEQRTKVSGALCGASRQFLISKLAAKANHNFMWLVLVHATILGSSLIDQQTNENLEKLINTIPGDLSDLYDNILRKLPKVEQPGSTEVLFLFQFVTYAREMLSVEELIDAISIWFYPGNWKEQRARFKSPGIFAKRIGELSGGLIQVQNFVSNGQSTVQFTHETVRAFLVEKGGLQILDPGANSATCHRQIFDLCLRYFECDPPTRQPELRLRQYASSFWMAHASGCDRLLRDSQIAYPVFVERCNVATKAIVALYHVNLNRRIQSGTTRAVLKMRGEDRILVLYASEGCAALVMWHHKSCPSCSKATRTGILNSALYLAAETSQLNVVRCLVEDLNCNLFIKNGRSTLLYRACYEGRDDLVRLLLELGADIYYECKQNYRTALNAAVGNRKKSTVEILLKHTLASAGGLLGQTDGYGQTPLHIAAKDGSHEIVNVLMEHAAKSEELSALNLIDFEGKTPQDLAIGSEEVLAILEMYKED